METIVLNNGISCPVVGIGTFMLSPKDAENSVREALKMGYRLIDTANAYVNERAVGRGTFLTPCHYPELLQGVCVPSQNPGLTSSTFSHASQSIFR